MRLFLLLGCLEQKEVTGSIGDVYGVANVDDDDGNGTPDWEQQSPPASDNDISQLTLEPFLVNALAELNSSRLRLEMNTDDIRIYDDAELKMNSEGDFFTLTSESVSEKVNENGAVSYGVEFGKLGTSGTLTVTLSVDDEVRFEQDVVLASSPVILSHHLQPFEHIYAMSTSTNRSFIQTFERVLGNRFTSYNSRNYQYDVWLQDEYEFGHLYGNATEIDVIVDSIRDRGINGLAEDHWLDEDAWSVTKGSGMANSQDSFGNLETSPPVVVDGVEYSQGRIYYGRWYNERMNTQLRDFLNEQEIQQPFEIDVSWLCVGHVDEFMTFVPDTSSEKGFKLLITDTEVGYEFLEGLPEPTSIPKYADHGYTSVAQILDDNGLRRLNQDIQSDYLDPIVDQLKLELGIIEQDIIRIPMLFEDVFQCAGTATLFPGTVNMVVATNEDGTADLFMPDPFLRNSSSLSDQESDPFIQYVNDLLPENNTPHWLDDWEDYHLMLGEVHCGSNTRRSPGEPWY